MKELQGYSIKLGMQNVKQYFGQLKHAKFCAECSRNKTINLAGSCHPDPCPQLGVRTKNV